LPVEPSKLRACFFYHTPLKCEQNVAYKREHAVLYPGATAAQLVPITQPNRNGHDVSAHALLRPQRRHCLDNPATSLMGMAPCSFHEVLTIHAFYEESDCHHSRLAENPGIADSRRDASIACVLLMGHIIHGWDEPLLHQ